MLNYLKKFTLEILPSVAATIIGAYIVNHYINRPAADPPVAAAVSPAEVKKNDPKSADGASDVASTPAPGVKAKGISERAMIEKSASERPGDFKPSEAKPAESKSIESKSTESKSTESKPSEVKPSETASLPVAKRPTPPAPPKAVAKTTPAPSASPTAPVETASAPAEDHRDANDLARAAIERLRKEDGQSHSQEASRAPDTSRLQEAPRTVVSPPTAPVSTAAVRPLPPPITVVAPPVEGQGNNQDYNQGSNPAPYTASVNADNPNRLVPPADIPPPPPIDLLRARATNLADRTNNVAHDVLAKTKSMFHSLMPGSNGDSGGGQGQSSSASQFTD